MCGLYGYTTTKPDSINPKLLGSLAIAMESRGDHATGIAYCHKDKCEIYKKAIEASKFINHKQYIKIIRSNPDLVIGHTRFATTGSRVDENAHPFKKGSIVGAHNGIISNYLEIDDHAIVDSEAIFSVLDRKNNSFKALKKIKGSFALTWIDQNNPNKLHMVAHENPLVLAITNDCIFWMSELHPLKAIINAFYGTKGIKFLELSDDMVYTVDRKTLELTQEKISLPSSYVSYTNRYFGKDKDVIRQEDDFKYNARPDYIGNNDYLDLACCYCGVEFKDLEETIAYDYLNRFLYCKLHFNKQPSEDEKYTDIMSLSEYLKDYQDEADI